MTTLHSLLAECERWVGVEPLGNDQWLEVAELRERVRSSLSATQSGEQRLALSVSAASFLSDVASRRNADGLE
jgi:hypothetical protein